MKISLPIRLLTVLIGVFLFGGYVDVSLVRGFYTFSLIFKEFLGAFLPFMVFFFIAAGILTFKKNAAKILFVLISSIFLSNLFITFVSFGIGKLMMPFVVNGISTKQFVLAEQLTPFFKFSLPYFLASEKMTAFSLHAMLIAVVVGIFLSFVSLPKVENLINKGKSFVEFILNNIFIPIIPIYVIGFLLKIKYEGILGNLFRSYGKAYVLIISLHIIYLFFMYLVASNFKLMEAIEYIRNSAASYLTAFSTMSSTATIPVTIYCAKKNIGNTGFASIATPIMANVHLAGDGISTPILSLVSMSIFLGFVPSIFVYSKFVFYFCLTMLAASGVPGGGIIVMLPILVSILSFTPEMLSMIITLYLLQDAFGTAANVMGDGALMIIINNWLRRFRII
ncbi:cation:dicarboxylase symporter family transporter [Candidatus Babeliales bacterium]|nr:cation:dicarboxylase symporter family transporter [Candidatus Babeliales bacterium]